MKRLIRWALNHIPRPVLQRMAGWAVPILGLFYRGRGVECPLCGSHYRRFLPYGYVHSRANALCPHCLSLERHRLLWLYLTRETDLLQSHPRTLHIAPEVCIMRHMKPHFAAYPGRYVTADLESPLADLHFDVQQIPLADNSVDVILCNHLLEHVADDRRALRELHRILKPGGWGIVLSPVEPDYEVRPPAHLRRRLRRPAARGGLRRRGHRLRRLPYGGGAPPLRPAHGPYLRGIQALTPGPKGSISREEGGGLRSGTPHGTVAGIRRC